MTAALRDELELLQVLICEKHPPTLEEQVLAKLCANPQESDEVGNRTDAAENLEVQEQRQLLENVAASAEVAQEKRPLETDLESRERYLWLEAGVCDCIMACLREGIRATPDGLRSMCYLLKQDDEIPENVHMTQREVMRLEKECSSFFVKVAADSQDEFELTEPPPWDQSSSDECNPSDLLAACLQVLPVSCPKAGDRGAALAGALRPKLVKKPRLCEIESVVQQLLDSQKAFLLDCGRWRWELVSAEEKADQKIPLPGSLAASRGFPAGAMPNTTAPKRKRGGKAKAKGTWPKTSFGIVLDFQ